MYMYMISHCCSVHPAVHVSVFTIDTYALLINTVLLWPYHPSSVSDNCTDLHWIKLTQLIMDPKRPCHRYCTMNVCHHCQQSLGYIALGRHRDLLHLYYPGYTAYVTSRQEISNSESSDSNFIPDKPSSPGNCSPASKYSEDNNPLPSLQSSSNSLASDVSESGPEVYIYCLSFPYFFPT